MATTDKAAAALDKLAAEVEAITTGEDWQRMLAVAARFHNYSAGNVMLILAQRPDATRVAGYRTWQSLGRQVRKGEHGMAILAPMVRKYEAETETGETETRRAVRGFRAVSVFDVSQTDGEPLPDVRPVLLDGDGDGDAYAAVAAWIEGQGYAVRSGDAHGANGYTDPAAREVVVGEGLSGRQSLKTLVHEAAHIALGHADAPTADYREHRGTCEVEAESVAFVVGEAIGLATGDYSFPYVAGWSGGDAAKVKGTADRVLKSARVLIEAIESATGVGSDEATSEVAA